MTKSLENQPFCGERGFVDVPSDLTVRVDGRSFALHKFPLVSRCRRIRDLIGDSDPSRIELHAVGADAFELVARFCYGMSFDVTPANVAELWRVSDYLEMTEEYSVGNLRSQAEEFVDRVVCRSLAHCVEVLRHCDGGGRVTGKCVEAIASKACAEQMASSFSRLEYGDSGRLQMGKQKKGFEEGDSLWIDEISELGVDMYEKVIVAVKGRGVRPESIGASLMKFAEKKKVNIKWNFWNLQPTPLQKAAEGDPEGRRKAVEMIVGLLPAERGAVPMSFLFGILRSAMILDCSSSTRLDLERRIGLQLDAAELDDLLMIPSISRNGETATLFDVDAIHRILAVFCQNEERDDSDDGSEAGSPAAARTSLRKACALIDGYLAEIAPDANLRMGKFMEIASTLPPHGRLVHDGVYRAVDVYLKAHQNLSDLDRKRLCKLIDFRKLSQEAAAHAAQNERLPLQSIVQVLYHEQIRLRNSLFSCSSYSDDDRTTTNSNGSVKPNNQQPSWRARSRSTAVSSPGENYASLRKENVELKFELARMRTRLNDLENDRVAGKNVNKSRSRKLMGSFSKKIARVFFA
ncbi:hypothetical protein M569_12572 [Genlisea aurea]|uniref:BTB/POZ domain-containing protein n=1 Tax=Genlisea aurea TaxID=192259 RepID=S8C5W8_9LAMI|nr:hypothetical protein M569_12572 [Genlisea aurea]